MALRLSHCACKVGFRRNVIVLPSSKALRCSLPSPTSLTQGSCKTRTGKCYCSCSYQSQWSSTHLVAWDNFLSRRRPPPPPGVCCCHRSSLLSISTSPPSSLSHCSMITYAGRFRLAGSTTSRWKSHVFQRWKHRDSSSFPDTFTNPLPDAGIRFDRLGMRIVERAPRSAHRADGAVGGFSSRRPPPTPNYVPFRVQRHGFKQPLHLVERGGLSQWRTVVGAGNLWRAGRSAEDVVGRYCQWIAGHTIQGCALPHWNSFPDEGKIGSRFSQKRKYTRHGPLSQRLPAEHARGDSECSLKGKPRASLLSALDGEWRRTAEVEDEQVRGIRDEEEEEELEGEEVDSEDDYEDEEEEEDEQEEGEEEEEEELERTLEAEAYEEEGTFFGAVEDGEESKSLTMEDRVFKLRERMLQAGDYGLGVREVQRLFPYPIDKFQRLAIKAMLEGVSVVVSAPTSSGKTLIAEAAAAVALARGRRLIYTTPLKALSNQKLREFRVKFGEGNVGLLTGDAAVNREAPVLVMTTEILRNMMYSSLGQISEGSGLMNVDVIVLDEVHYLSDVSRGTVWEESVIYCPKEVQLLCLSATVANSDELADWISQVHGPTQLITSTKRPVPLMWHFSTKQALIPLLNHQSTAMNRRLLPSSRFEEMREEELPFALRRLAQKRRGGRERERVRSEKQSGRRTAAVPLSKEEEKLLRRTQVPQLRDTLRQLAERNMLPAIWFLFSRRGCDQALGMLHSVQLLNEREKCAVGEALEKFKATNAEAVRESAVSPLMRGLASHHAGCLPAWKGFIEELFQEGLIKVVFATETLAAGVNMPARTTVLSALRKRGENGHEFLAANSMLQMAGRAGRRGIDKQGHVVVVQTPFEDPEDCCSLLFGGVDPLVSQFTATYGMVLNLLQGGGQYQQRTETGGTPLPAESQSQTQSGHAKMGRTMDEARALVERSFGNYLGNEATAMVKKKLRRLEQELDDLALNQEEAVRKLREEPQDGSLAAWKKYVALKEQVQMEKRSLRRLRDLLDDLRVARMQLLLDDELATQKYAPFVELRFKDQSTRAAKCMCVFLVGSIPRPFFITEDEPWEGNKDYDDDGDDDFAGLTSRWLSTKSNADNRELGDLNIGESAHGGGLAPGAVRSSDRTAGDDNLLGGGDSYLAEIADEGGFAATRGGKDRMGAGGPNPADTYGVDPCGDESSAGEARGANHAQPQRVDEVRYYVGLGPDNNWYVFTAKYAAKLYRVAPDAVAAKSAQLRLTQELQEKIRLGSRNWACVTPEDDSSPYGHVWLGEGSFDTWLWSASIPQAGALPCSVDVSDSEVVSAEKALQKQRTVVSKLRKTLKSLPQYKQEKKALHAIRKQEENITSLGGKVERLRKRIDRMAPTGWREFTHVVKVLERLRAIDTKEEVLLPLGQMAAALRGTNELWLAVAFSEPSTHRLTAAELASACATLVTDIKVRQDFGKGLPTHMTLYRPSQPVVDWLEAIEPKRLAFCEAQFQEGVDMPIELDDQFAGMVEAWASGVSWSELMMDCVIDEGDIARLLRRTIDLLVQLRHLPHIDISLKRVARTAATVMDRPPISELIE